MDSVTLTIRMDFVFTLILGIMFIVVGGIVLVGIHDFIKNCQLQQQVNSQLRANTQLQANKGSAPNQVIAQPQPQTLPLAKMQAWINAQVQTQSQRAQFQPLQWQQPQLGLIYGYSIMWHGTTDINIAIDIVMYDRWLIGSSSPPGVWITPEWDYAIRFRVNEGVKAVVKVKIAHDSHLTQEAPDRFRVPVGNTNDGKYYRVFGIKPVEVYDRNGNQIY